MPNDLEACFRELADTGLVRRLIELARDEDLGPDRHDVTTWALGLRGSVRAEIRAREPMIVAGLRCLDLVLASFGVTPSDRTRTGVQDGDRVEEGVTLASFTAPVAGVLQVERTLLNLIGRLSGIATHTARFVAAIEGTGARLYDTRKTTPGLRVLEKYAVRCGGGCSHRLGLHDAVLVKDNHLAAMDDLQAGLRRARERAGDVAFFEVEVDALSQLEQVAEVTGVDIVLLDNMSTESLREACAIRDRLAPDMMLEASGGITIDTIRDVAATGIDRISVGALTHGARSVDVGLDVT